ncbi:MAG: hypothetical protein AMXMBFR84_49260 [Candidatus Hydrogenedentota bacterium]
MTEFVLRIALVLAAEYYGDNSFKGEANTDLQVEPSPESATIDPGGINDT